MEDLYEPIVPNELIVGISGDMSYVTYYEGKKLNSEKSWTSWSDNASNPNKVKNKFSKGFKLGRVNGRYSRQAANAENLVIVHPLFNKGFEISLHRFIEIANRTTIINGVIQDELIMDKSRNILFRDEYEELVKEHQIKIEKQKKIAEKNKEKKIKGSEQIPGKFYIDTKTNNEYVYLGTATVDDKLKYCYIEAYKVKPIHKTETIHYGGSFYETPKTIIKSLKYPTICYVDGRSFRNVEEYNNSKLKDFYFSDNSGYMRITTSRITMSESQNKKNIFDEFTEEDWEIVDKCYNKDNSSKKDRWGRVSISNYILKGIKAVHHFKEDYLKTKNDNNLINTHKDSK